MNKILICFLILFSNSFAQITVNITITEKSEVETQVSTGNNIIPLSDDDNYLIPPDADIIIQAINKSTEPFDILFDSEIEQIKVPAKGSASSIIPKYRVETLSIDVKKETSLNVIKNILLQVKFWDVNPEFIAYYDALILKNYKNYNNASIKRILEVYNYGETNDIMQAYIDNPFMDKNILQYASLEAQATGANSFIINAIKSAGQMDVTNFADGLAKFLVERGKDELYVAFFDHLESYLEKSPELNALFPNTVILLKNFKAWQYSNLLNTFKEALDKDLKDIMKNLSTLNNVEGINEKLKSFLTSEAGNIFILCLKIGDGLVSDEKIPDILTMVAADPAVTNSHNTSIKSVVYLAEIISSSLKSKEPDKQYIEDLSLLVNDREFTNIYLGLIWQQIKKKGIEFNNVKIADVINSGSVNQVKNYLANIKEDINTLNNAYQNLKNAVKQDDNIWRQYASVMQSTNDFINAVFDLKILDKSFGKPKEVDIFLKYSSSSITIAQDISVRNYNAVVFDVYKLVYEITKDNAQKDSIKKFLSDFLKYTSFAANVVSAKNSDDVKSAIEAVALPSGSSSIKKNSCFNISINSYIGGFYGQEYLRNISVPGQGKSTAGISAPVGLGFNFGTPGNTSLSLFIPLIDVGALASFRLDDSTSAALPVKLENIFAPGIGVVIGFPWNWPISLGWMHQYGPVSREVDPAFAVNGEGKLNFRNIFFLSVDIPIFNILTISRD